MQKVYLLLRSNKQTGPYSLEELLQLNLKPFDLVWVDGRSAAWQYPFEIPALKPFVPETPQAQAFQPIATEAMDEKKLQPPALNSQPQNPTPRKTEASKRVFVSVPKTITPTNEQTNLLPVGDQKSSPGQGALSEHKAYMPPVEEALNSRAGEIKSDNPSYATRSRNPVKDEVVSTNYTRSLHDVEEDYTQWVYQKKTKKKASVNPKDLALAVLILAVIGGGYYVMSRPSVTNSVLPTNKATGQNAQVVAEKLPDEAGPQKNISPEQGTTAVISGHPNSPKETKQPKNIKTKNQVTVSKGQTNSSALPAQNSMPVEKTPPNIQDHNADDSREPEVRQKPKETVTPEKKKKFGEVLKGIFAKKEKKEDVTSGSSKDQVPVTEDPRPATNRQASRRDATGNTKDDNSTPSEVSSASLMEQVDLSSNAPDNWMMGVKNLKITLKNRSNVTIQAASVTVIYYDENNQLLDKKLIYFSNVAPKAKATVNAPDHKFADHVEYKLTTINAKEDRFARN